MSRPAGDADKRLIRAAMEMIPQGGLAGLSVRRVAARAGVNLGMYHYHFKSKQEFHRRILDSVYETFFSRLTGALEGAGGKSPRERLKKTVLEAAGFIRENRALMFGLARDLLADNPEVIRFARINFPRHLVLLMKLVKDCQKFGDIRPMPMVHVLPFLFASVIGPVFAMGFIGKILPTGFREIPLAAMKSVLATDTRLEERLDMSLDALAPARRRGRK
jgi:AcrR family transcriptional regulator